MVQNAGILLSSVRTIASVIYVWQLFFSDYGMINNLLQQTGIEPVAFCKGSWSMALVILLILFPPKLVLPLNYIPYDNIFELKHYLNTFIEQMQLTNAELAVGNGYYARLSLLVIAFLSLLFLLLIPLFLSIVTRLRAMIRSKKA